MADNWWEAIADKGYDNSTKYASAYEGLASGPRAGFSYEDQEGIPVDGSNKAARNYSPFPLRLIPPSLEDVPASFVTEGANVNVDLYGQAGQSMEANNQTASSVLGAYGFTGLATPAEVANQLNQQIVIAHGAGSAALFEHDDQPFRIVGILKPTGTPVDRTTLTDTMTAMDIAAQVAQILGTPPLTLLVNPNSMNITYTGIQAYQERGREGFIFQRWGENQPTIKFQGRTGAFIAGESRGGIANASIQAFKEPGTTASPTGVQFASKRDSASFQNFQALYQIYRNNGYIYDRVGGTEAHLAIGAVAIDYDQWTYVGHIESFNYAYDTSQIHALEWDMEFVVDVMYDRAQAPYAVLPLKAPTPNPSDPGGGGKGSVGARGNTASGWFNITGAEDDFAGVRAAYAEEFGVPPDPAPQGTPVTDSQDSLVVTNPDGTLTLTNPNLNG